MAKEKQSERDKERAKNETKFKLKRAKEQEKHRKKKEKDSKARIKSFRNAVKYGRIFECICCHRALFQKGVHKIKNEDKFISELETKFPGLYDICIGKMDKTKKVP